MKNLTPIQKKRVAIAKDVLKHLNAKNIIANKGQYVKIKARGKYAGKQLKDVLPKIKECKVCVLGGMFYSYVAKHNNYIIPDNQRGIHEITNQDTEMRELLNMFSEKQLHLIETAFEGRFCCVSSGNMEYSSKTIRKAVDFRGRNDIMIFSDEGDDKAMRAIMANIIKNNGIFRL